LIWGGRSTHLVRSLPIFVRFKALLHIIRHNYSIGRLYSLKSPVLKAQLLIIEYGCALIRANCPPTLRLLSFEIVAHLLVVVQFFFAKGQDTQFARDRVVRTHEPVVNCSHSFIV
jgi:hypothetical protein